jgi:hypothetical protein
MAGDTNRAMAMNSAGSPDKAVFARAVLALKAFAGDIGNGPIPVPPLVLFQPADQLTGVVAGVPLDCK